MNGIDSWAAKMDRKSPLILCVDKTNKTDSMTVGYDYEGSFSFRNCEKKSSN